MEHHELSWRERGRLWLRLAVRLALTVLFVALILHVGWPVASLCMPFVLALFLTWLLNPLVVFLEKRTPLTRRGLSILLILLILVGLGGLIGWLFYRLGVEMVALAGSWDTIWAGVQTTADQLSSLLSELMTRYQSIIPPKLETTIFSLYDQFLSWLRTYSSSLLPKAGTWAMGLPSFGLALIFFLMASYFLLADYPHIRSLVTSQVPGNVRRFFALLKNTFNAAFSGYIRAQLLLSLGVFIILGGGFFLMGQEYSLLLAFLLAVLDFIPIVGAGTVMLPWAVICLLLNDPKKAIALFMIWSVIAMFRRVAEPKAVGSQTGLPPILSLLSIYVGMKLAGVLGMVFGPAILLVILNVCTSGVFDGAVADLELASRDLIAFLQNRGQQDP